MSLLLWHHLRDGNANEANEASLTNGRMRRSTTKADSHFDIEARTHDSNQNDSHRGIDKEKPFRQSGQLKRVGVLDDR